jgi:DNA-binding NarL/FixJ family response regulator
MSAPQYREGYRVIAERTGKTYHQVREAALADGSAHSRVRRTDGKETPGSTRGRPERIRKVHELRAAGATIRGIAAELGCSTYTVSRDLEPDHGEAFSPPAPAQGSDLDAAATWG